MNFKYLLLITISIFSFCFFGNTKDIYVNDASTTGDVWCTAAGSAGGTGTISNPLNALKSALTNAVSGDVIYVDAGIYSEKSLLAKSGVTVIGAGAYKTSFTSSGMVGIWFMKIYGINDFSISNIKTSGYVNNDATMGQNFTILNSSNISIKKVTLSKNNGTNGDAAIFVGSNSSNITIDETVISCQNNSLSGTGIVASGQNISLIIKNSLFSGNDNSNQGSNGSALQIKSDAIVTPNVVLNVENCFFSQNTSKSGGALYIEGGSVTINKCKFINNKSTNSSGTDGGGAIWISKTNSECIISNSEFKNNTSSSSGGAIQVYSTVASADVKIENCKFEKNTASLYGNDIHTRRTASKTFLVNILNCIFDNSITNIVSGPAISGPCVDGVLKVNNSGMPSTVGLNGSLDPACKSTINIDNLPSGYTDPGITFPTYQETCPDAAICNPAIPGTSPTVSCPATSVILTATGPTGSNYTWYDVYTGGNPLGVSTPSSPDFLVSNITGTKTFYVVSDIDNCQTRVPITVNCTACPSLSYDGALCNTGSISPTINPISSASNYTCVSANKADLIINSTTGVIDLAASKPGTYDIKCIITPGSCEPATTLTIYPKPIIADITKSICSGGIIDFAPIGIAPNSIPSGTTYTWTVTPPTGISGASSETSPKSRIVQSLTNTTNNPIDVVYNFVATSGTAPIFCTNTFKVTVTVKPKPATPILGTPVDPTCNTDGSVLISGLPTVFSPKQWTLKSAAKYNFSTTGNTPTYNYTSLKSNNKIKFIVELDGCQSDSTSELTISNAPGKPFIEGPSSVCVGSEITLKAWTDNTPTKTKSTPSGTTPWSLKVPGDLDTVSLTLGTDATITSNIIKGLKAASSTKSGEATIVYTDINGCVSEQSISVNTIPTLTPMNTGSGVCVWSQLALKASIPGGVWTCLTPQFAEVSFNNLYPKTGVTGLNTAEIKYQLDQKNCNASIIEYVKIYPEPKIEGYTKSICVGDTITFKDVENRDPLNEKTIWSLTNNSVATIDQNGLLKAIKSGGSEVLGKNVFGCVSQSFINIRPTAVFDDTTINVCSGDEKSLIPIIKNASSSLNPTFKWTVTNNTLVDGETEMLSLVPAFKQTLTNKTGNDQTVNYLLTSSVGSGSDVCLTTRKLNLIVSSALDIVGPANIDLTQQIQYTSLNKSVNSLNWTTSNPQVIMVNANGLVAPKGVGSAIVSVSNAFGCSAQMNVNVSQNQIKKITGQNIVCEGSFATLTGFGNPKSVDPWTSSNVNVLTISVKGEVSAVKAGKALVTYFDDQGGKDTMTITVKTRPFVDPMIDFNICPGKFADSIKFGGTNGATFDWTNSNTATGIIAKGQKMIYPFNASNYGSSNLTSEINVTPRLGECIGTPKKFNIVVRFIPQLYINQIDTVVCPGGNINFKTVLTPVNTSTVYQWYVNDIKVGANTSIFWSNTLKSKDKITVNVTSKDFCPTTSTIYVRMDSLYLSMNVPSMVYLKAPVVNLIGYPSGGVFSGKGVANNKLDPSIATVGNKTITYSFKNANNCIGMISQKVVIYDTVFNNCHLTTYDTVTVMDTVSILKIKFKLTTGIKANQETTMRVYPNPTSDILVIEAEDEKALAGYRYKIVDAAGKEVYNQPVKSIITEISLKSLGAAGTYFFEVFDEKLQRVVSKKIILD